MSQGNEILTLAFGHYSCHLAANYFNIQEATFSYNPNFSSGIDHSLSFRENSRRANLLTPRLVLVDDEDSLGYLSREGFYKQSNDNFDVGASEDDPSIIIKETKWGKNEFISEFVKEKQRLQSDNDTFNDFLLKSSYNIDESVTSWSDYLTTEYDEKTIVTVPKFTEWYQNYEQFTCFDSGLSLWNDSFLNEKVEENIRFFLEEADNLQGFQVFTDGGNGYSGVSSGCVELLKDEYSKKVIFSVPSIFLDVTKEEDLRVQNKQRCDRIYSLASSFSSYSEFCDLVAPMSHLHNPWAKEPTVRTFRNIKYRHDLMYHTSGILSAAIDLFTLPYRLQNVPSNMHHLSSILNIYGRSFTTVGINLPLPVSCSKALFPSADELDNKLFDSLTPMIDVNPDRIDIQSISSKGLGRNVPSQINLSELQDLDGDFKRYLQTFFPRSFTKVASCKSTFRVPRTFPKVLNNQFNLVSSEHEFGPISEYISVGGLHNSKEMHTVLCDLYDAAKLIKKRSIPGFRPRDSEIDYNSLFENLKNCTEAYDESYHYV